MTIEEMQELRKECGYSYSMIAEGTELPLSTVQKVFGGQTKSPRYETLQRLNRYFEYQQHIMRMNSRSAVKSEPLPQWLREPTAYHVKKKKQGEFTVEDYRNFPDDYRVELIDGVVIEMEGPHSGHQMIAGEVYRQIANYIKAEKGKYIPGIAPLDVQLDQDIWTMVQPDVMIVCDRDKFIKGNVFGAPDWVMEVISKYSKRKDCVKKLNKYMEAGVREYWIVDPQEQTVTVYDFEHSRFPMNYTFEDQIPIAILEGKLKIDMREVKEYLYMYDEN